MLETQPRWWMTYPWWMKKEEWQFNPRKFWNIGMWGNEAKWEPKSWFNGDDFHLRMIHGRVLAFSKSNFLNLTLRIRSILKSGGLMETQVELSIMPQGSLGVPRLGRQLWGACVARWRHHGCAWLDHKGSTTWGACGRSIPWFLGMRILQINWFKRLRQFGGAWPSMACLNKETIHLLSSRFESLTLNWFAFELCIWICI